MLQRSLDRVMFRCHVTESLDRVMIRCHVTEPLDRVMIRGKDSPYNGHSRGRRATLAEVTLQDRLEDTTPTCHAQHSVLL